MGGQKSRPNLPGSVKSVLRHFVQAESDRNYPGLAIFLQRDDGIDSSWIHFTKQKYSVVMITLSCPTLGCLRSPVQTSLSSRNGQNPYVAVLRDIDLTSMSKGASRWRWLLMFAEISYLKGRKRTWSMWPENSCTVHHAKYNQEGKEVNVTSRLSIR